MYGSFGGSLDARWINAMDVIPLDIKEIQDPYFNYRFQACHRSIELFQG